MLPATRPRNHSPPIACDCGENRGACGMMFHEHSAIAGGSMRSSRRQSSHRYSYEEYLAYERDSAMNHEYDAGEIMAMSGGSRRHNALASHISAALEVSRRPECESFESEHRVCV